MRERSPGTWELTVSTGRDPETGRYGRVIRTVHASSRRQAKAALARLEVEVASGQVGTSDPTAAELLERWLEHLARLGRSESTLYNYREYIDRELGPAIGALRLSKLTARHLDGLYTALAAQGLAPATIRQVHALMRAALNQAVRWGLVGRNVASLASAPSQPQREQHPPTAEQVQALIDAAAELEPMFGMFVRVVAATGMRGAEACGLRWSDVDLATGRVTVERSHLALPGIVGDRPTKTRSARTLTLDPGTTEALRSGWLSARQLARFAGIDDDTRRAGYVFSFDADGATAWRGDTVTARWTRARRAPRAVRGDDRKRVNGRRLHPNTAGFSMATFRQTTSRADDPQLHSHAVISAKVPPRTTEVLRSRTGRPARTTARHRSARGTSLAAPISGDQANIAPPSRQGRRRSRRVRLRRVGRQPGSGRADAAMETGRPVLGSSR